LKVKTAYDIAGMKRGGEEYMSGNHNENDAAKFDNSLEIK